MVRRRRAPAGSKTNSETSGKIDYVSGKWKKRRQRWRMADLELLEVFISLHGWLWDGTRHVAAEERQRRRLGCESAPLHRAASRRYRNGTQRFLGGNVEQDIGGLHVDQRWHYTKICAVRCNAQIAGGRRRGLLDAMQMTAGTRQRGPRRRAAATSLFLLNRFLLEDWTRRYYGWKSRPPRTRPLTSRESMPDKPRFACLSPNLSVRMFAAFLSFGVEGPGAVVTAGASGGVGFRRRRAYSLAPVVRTHIHLQPRSGVFAQRPTAPSSSRAPRLLL